MAPFNVQLCFNYGGRIRVIFLGVYRTFGTYGAYYWA